MNTCLNCGKMKHSAVTQGCTCQYSMQAPPEQGPRDIAALVQGMEVSIDVSTSDHDAGHRLFGTVTLVQESQKGKHGLILLVQDPQPNFKAQRKPWVNLTDDEIQAVAKQARSKDHAVTLTVRLLKEKNT